MKLPRGGITLLISLVPGDPIVSTQCGGYIYQLYARSSRSDRWKMNGTYRHKNQIHEAEDPREAGALGLPACHELWKEPFLDKPTYPIQYFEDFDTSLGSHLGRI
jgi:hypothetical protein